MSNGLATAKWHRHMKADFFNAYTFFYQRRL
jgi:hypothetical protein